MGSAGRLHNCYDCHPHPIPPLIRSTYTIPPERRTERFPIPTVRSLARLIRKVGRIPAEIAVEKEQAEGLGSQFAQDPLSDALTIPFDPGPDVLIPFQIGRVRVGDIVVKHIQLELVKNIPDLSIRIDRFPQDEASKVTPKGQTYFEVLRQKLKWSGSNV